MLMRMLISGIALFAVGLSLKLMYTSVGGTSSIVTDVNNVLATFGTILIICSVYSFFR